MSICCWKQVRSVYSIMHTNTLFCFYIISVKIINFISELTGKLPCYDIAFFPKWHNIKFNKSSRISNLTFLKRYKIKADQRS